MMHAQLPVARYLPGFLIAIFYAVISVSLVADLHFWILLLCFCACIVRFFLYLGWYNHAPGKRTINLLALLASAALITTSDDIDILHIMVNLLLLACSLKLMLLNRRRDFYQLVISGVFLVACGFIFYQSLVRSLFYIAAFGLLIVVLLAAHTPNLRLSQQSRKAFVLLFQALPIAVLLFVFMPKIPPFWKMPEGKSTETGLSEHITPGDIANLTKSEKLAFTASFDGPIPAPHQRYWRAIVLEDFDGESWSVSETRRYASAQLQEMGRQFSPQVKGEPFRYEVISEPTQQRWLYALDTAVPASEESKRDIIQGWNYQLLANQPLFSRFSYSVNSFPDTPRDQGIVSIDNRVNLQAPVQTNTQTQLWVKELRARYPDNEAYANAIMNFFKDNEFEYTLAPSAMPYNPIDNFLFTHRAGFCAHYASAMAYALRLAGIPARVVSGYQGGKQINDTTINVYQYDAHAWVEAWLDDTGWQTFDPTTQVAPSRISAGFEEAARFSGELMGEHPFTGLGHLEAFAFFRTLSAQMDFLWGKWFLGFNSEKQNAFFSKLLGDLSPWKLSLLGIVIVLAILSALALYFLPDWRRKSRPPHYKLYLGATDQLYRHCNIARKNQSPGELLHTLETELSPMALAPFRVITAYFEHCEYGGPTVSAAEAKVASRKFIKALKRSSR